MAAQGGKERLDVLIVQRGFAASRSQAQTLIRAGRVKVAGQTMDKPGSLVAPSSPVEVRTPPPYASRGGEKLEFALRAFGVDPTGRVCLDIGASTGGFTDCLLQHGAARVYAVDVGKGLLDWRLRQDPRVIVEEGVNARYLGAKHVPEPISLAVLDVAFISLRLVLPALRPFIEAQGDVLALVKPQFEAGRKQVRRGGVVRDPAVHHQVLEDMKQFIKDTLRWGLWGVTISPLHGPAGNIEFFIHLRPGMEDPASIDLQAIVEEAHTRHPAQANPSQASSPAGKKEGGTTHPPPPDDPG